MHLLSSSAELADLLIDVRKGLFTIVLLPHLVVVSQIKLKHLVKVLPGQLSLGIESHIAVFIHGKPLQPLLQGNHVHLLDGADPGGKSWKFNDHHVWPRRHLPIDSNIDMNILYSENAQVFHLFGHNVSSWAKPDGIDLGL